MPSDIRRSCSMLASGLLLTNTESTRESPAGRQFLSKSSADNARQAIRIYDAKGGPDSYQAQRSEKFILLHPYFSERVAMIKAVVGRRWHQAKKHLN